jgi:hypothetical protein
MISMAASLGVVFYPARPQDLTCAVVVGMARFELALEESRNERYRERLPWRMHGRYDDGRTGLCHMYDASTTLA